MSSSRINLVFPKLEHELDRLQKAGAGELKQQWRRRMGAEPSHLSADLVRRRLAYEIQSRICGTAKPQLIRQLVELNAAFQADPNYSPYMSHALTPGTVLVREWRRRTYKVHVVEDGFLYASCKYDSLSEIAQCITGAKWSGPAFFGLQKRKRLIQV